MTQPPFIRRVGLDNFKSVRSQQIDLAPLTIVVGRNSAGKSTLIQSILAMAQASNVDHLQGLIWLNGHLVKLGTFAELKNFRAAEGEEPTISLSTVVAAEDVPSGLGMSDEEGPLDFEVTVEVTLAEYRSISESQARIDWLSLWATPYSAGKDFEMIVELELGGGGPDLELNQRDWQPHDNRLIDRQYSATGVSTERLDGVELHGVIPISPFRFTSVGDWLLRNWWGQYESHLSELIATEKLSIAHERAVVEKFQDAPKPKNPSNNAPRAALREFKYSALNHGLEELQEMILDGNVLDHKSSRSSSYSQKNKALARSMAEHGQASFNKKVRQLLESAAKNQSDARALLNLWDQTVKLPPSLNGYPLLNVGQRQLRTTLSNIKYLGPIRNPDWSSGPSVEDIGSAGEYAPTVLRARASEPVAVPLPDMAGDAQQLNTVWNSAESTTVGYALNKILKFLDLVDEASSTDHGRFGVGFDVRPTGLQQDVDLTAVGVGVSQALPIVLLLVLSKPGDVIILEQPELHLHPAMQLRMADLLLNFARNGRQVIVETHSEHIVNRIRRRVVETPKQLNDTIMLQFAETDAEHNTVYRPSAINPDGTLSDDWPEGFFEVASDEATELLKALIQQRRKEDA